MKKYFTMVLCVLFLTGSVFAQTAVDATDDTDNNSADSRTVQMVTPKDQHTTNKTAKVEIEFIPLSDEVRIYYTCMDVTFDQGEAMNTIYACLEDFKKQNQYYGYKFLSKDRIRYYKDGRNVKMATYMSYVQMTR
jgi:hypothetical protein